MTYGQVVINESETLSGAAVLSGHARAGWGIVRLSGGGTKCRILCEDFPGGSPEMLEAVVHEAGGPYRVAVTGQNGVRILLDRCIPMAIRLIRQD